jgi:hypothetical protein
VRYLGKLVKFTLQVTSTFHALTLPGASSPKGRTLVAVRTYLLCPPISFFNLTGRTRAAAG